MMKGVQVNNWYKVGIVALVIIAIETVIRAVLSLWTYVTVIIATKKMMD